MEEIKKPEVAAAKAPKVTYQVSDQYSHLPFLVWRNAKGKRINLIGTDVEIPREATPDDPRTSVKLKGATQEDYAEYVKLGNQNIVEVA